MHMHISRCHRQYKPKAGAQLHWKVTRSEHSSVNAIASARNRPDRNRYKYVWGLRDIYDFLVLKYHNSEGDTSFYAAPKDLAEHKAILSCAGIRHRWKSSAPKRALTSRSIQSRCQTPRQWNHFSESPLLLRLEGSRRVPPETVYYPRELCVKHSVADRWSH